MLRTLTIQLLETNMAVTWRDYDTEIGYIVLKQNKILVLLIRVLYL